MNEIESYFGNETLNDIDSPQFKAAVWIAGEDDALTLESINPEIRTRLIQRYALAVLFYATGGATHWISQSNFLSSDHECSWNMDVIPEPGTELFFALTDPDDPSDNFQNGVLKCKIMKDLGQVVTKVTMIDNNMTGQIPPEVFIGLPELEMLNLVKNKLHGTIPEEIYDSKLAAVWLALNSLTGTISPAVQNLGNTLHNLWIAYNDLSGTIPTEIGQLTLLENFGFSKNRLNGTIPKEVSEMQNLELFDVQGCSLSGWTPNAFTNISRLKVLDLGYNEIGGSIPDDIGYLCPSMQYLQLPYTGISGSIPFSIGSLSTLVLLSLQGNQLTGSIEPVADLSTAWGITIQYNSLNGTIPRALGNTEGLGK